tara:strand:+ start:2698 stop:3111 length:414 start_codon:yes stop_codon:yes gene_type:complete
MSFCVKDFTPEWVFCFNPAETKLEYIWDNVGGIIKMNATQHTKSLKVGDWAVIKRGRGNGMFKDSRFIAVCEIVGFEDINGTDQDHEDFALEPNRGRHRHQARFHRTKAVLQVHWEVDEPLQNPIKYQGSVHRYLGH